jgi:hypothetical protein
VLVSDCSWLVLGGICEGDPERGGNGGGNGCECIERLIYPVFDQDGTNCDAGPSCRA